jgi:recombination protein RecA
MSDLIELLRKKYKKVYHGHSMPELQHCSCGLLSLDLALGGGLPRGRIIQLYGPPSSGKSTLAFTFVRAFQHREEPCLYIDLEGTGQKNDMQRHRLLENETFNYAAPPDGEEAINMALDAAEYGARLVVIDSVPYLRSKDAVNKDVGERSFAAVSTLISNNLNKLTHTFRTTNSILLLINQLRANTDAGRYGPSTKPSGGAALQYLSSLSLSITKRQKLDDGSGIISAVRADKTKIAAAFQEVELYIHYTTGISEVHDLFSSLSKMNIIQRSGAYYSLEAEVASIIGCDAKLGRGAEGVTNWLEQNPQIRRRLHEVALERLNQLELATAPDSDVEFDPAG